MSGERRRFVDNWMRYCCCGLGLKLVVVPWLGCRSWKPAVTKRYRCRWDFNWFIGNALLCSIDPLIWLRSIDKFEKYWSTQTSHKKLMTITIVPSPFFMSVASFWQGLFSNNFLGAGRLNQNATLMTQPNKKVSKIKTSRFEPRVHWIIQSRTHLSSRCLNSFSVKAYDKRKMQVKPCPRKV
jgi:hypothetical protein